MNFHITCFTIAPPEVIYILMSRYSDIPPCLPTADEGIFLYQKNKNVSRHQQETNWIYPN